MSQANLSPNPNLDLIYGVMWLGIMLVMSAQMAEWECHRLRWLFTLAGHEIIPAPLLREPCWPAARPTSAESSAVTNNHAHTH